MTDRILEECARRGTCMLNRTEFDEAFAGKDITIQIRAAIDFAQQKDLAFARSSGDQHFVFSRLPKLEGQGAGSEQNSRRRHRRGRNQKPGSKRGPGSKPGGASRRPIGRSF